MLQQDKSEDFVIATGVQYTVRQFITWAAAELGITLKSEGEGVDEIISVVSVYGDKAPAVKPGDILVRIAPRYFSRLRLKLFLAIRQKQRKNLAGYQKLPFRSCALRWLRRI